MTYAIDFGTSNTLVADVATQQIIPLHKNDQPALRSILYSPEPDLWLFGAEAVQKYLDYTASGRLFRSLKKHLPDPSFTHTVLHGKKMSLTDLIAVFLTEVKRRADEHTGRKETSVLMGRPAAFSLNEEKDKIAEGRLKAAALMAGFTSVAFCPEPLAAAYAFNSALAKDTRTLIADFGGGTSDFTVLTLGSDHLTRDHVHSLGGIPTAGDRFDGRLMERHVAKFFGADITYKVPMGNNLLSLPKHLIAKMCSPADIGFLTQADIRRYLEEAQKWAESEDDQIALENLFTLIDENLTYKLFHKIEEAKITLSGLATTPFLFDIYSIHIDTNIPASAYHQECQSLVHEIMKVMDDTVSRSGFSYRDIDLICSTGGTAHLPPIQQALKERLGEEKVTSFRPFQSVIEGLAAFAKAAS